MVIGSRALTLIIGSSPAAPFAKRHEAAQVPRVLPCIDHSFRASLARECAPRADKTVNFVARCR